MKNPSLENKKDQRDLQVRHFELRAVAKTLSLSVPSTLKRQGLGCLDGSMIEHLPLAQGMISGPGIKSCTGIPTENLLLPLPVSLPFSLYLS